MIGKLIPAGTGMKRYRGIEVDYGDNEPLMKAVLAEEDASPVITSQPVMKPEDEGLSELVGELMNNPV